MKRAKESHEWLETTTLVDRYRAGDDDAARLLFDRYFLRLTALARSRLSAKLAVRVDADDIVQSAYRSFFVHARDGALTVDKPGDLWRLLVEITLHKLYRQAKKHGAAKRSFRREVSRNELSYWPAELVSREPSPDEIAAVVDELEAVLKELPPSARRVVELRLQGEEQKAIAEQLGISERTVRRWLDETRAIMERRRGAPSAQSGSRDASKRRQTSANSRPAARTGHRRLLTDKIELPESVPQIRYEDYVLEKMIGSGTSGKVYRARSKQTRRLVAVKFLRKSFLSDAAAVSRFLTEAETIGRLQHPHILPLFGIGQSRVGTLFFITELARDDLQQRVVRKQRSISQVIRWIRQAASGVQFAHEHGIVHCDLKPANLLLLRGSRLVVSDFGLAQSVEDATGRFRAGGTPAFMAPEQISEHWGSISQRTDVFGLGAVLFTLLTGQPPFGGQRVADIMAEIVSRRPCRSPRELRAGIPEELCNTCDRALSKNPSRRFQTVFEFLASVATNETRTKHR